METKQVKKCRSSMVLMVLALMTSGIFLVSGIRTYQKYKEFGGDMVLFFSGFFAFVFFLDAIRFYRQRRTDRYYDRKEEARGRKPRKSLGRGIFGICLGAAVFGTMTFLLSQMVDYSAKVPKIIAMDTVTCHINEELHFEDLASYRVLEGTKVLTWMDIYSNPASLDARISEDQQTLHTGSAPGELRLELSANGVESKSKIITLIIKEEE